MKKSILLIALVSAALTSITSCKKEEHNPPVVQNITANLKVNESYTFTLPSTDEHKSYHISTEAAHASISFVRTTANGSDVYQYTPALNYSGNDFVSITNMKETQCTTGNGGGHCGHHHHCDDDDDGQQNIVNISFTIGGSNATSGTSPATDK